MKKDNRRRGGASVVAAVFGSCFGVKGPEQSVDPLIPRLEQRRSSFHTGGSHYNIFSFREERRSIPWCSYKIYNYHDDDTATASTAICALLCGQQQ